MPIRSRWTDQYQQLSSQSKFHEKVRQIFCNADPFKNFTCYQEVPVRDLVEDYDAVHFYDWYIEELMTVVELHGAQHYKPTSYGNQSYEQKMKNFKDMQARDSKKKSAAISAGYEYVEISYKHYAKLDADRLKQLLWG